MTEYFGSFDIPLLGDALLASAGATAAIMLSLWLISLLLRNSSIVDGYWGPGFLVITLVAGSIGSGATCRTVLVTTLVALWSLRLGGYIIWRNYGGGEDYRYAAMREHHGSAYAWVSLVTIFGLQGVLMWLISMPLQMAVLSPRPPGWTVWDVVGLTLWCAGFLFETVGDWQLARFKADPQNRGQVMDKGLWAWTRHPNYFGEAVLWWGYFFIALSTPIGIWTVLSPMLMTYLLLKFSGVALLEKALVDRRPGYREYVERTSAFFPWPPRGAKK
jgi:steroid 5-alpha reductase family enzyme